MSRYSVAVQALPAQTFTARLGKNTVTVELQWMARLEVFRMSIITIEGLPLTLGRFLHPGSDMLAGLYPPSSIAYGCLRLEGDQPTPDNLGVANLLVWSNDR